MTINGQYYCTVFQDKVSGVLRLKQPELLQRGVILLLDNTTYHSYLDVQNLVQHSGWEV
jgi:hypothetical protein